MLKFSSWSSVLIERVKPLSPNQTSGDLPYIYKKSFVISLTFIRSHLLFYLKQGTCTRIISIYGVDVILITYYSLILPSE